MGYTVQHCTLSAVGAVRVDQWHSAVTVNVSVHGSTQQNQIALVIELIS